MGDYLSDLEHVVMLAVARLGGDAYGTTIHQEIVRTTGRDIAVPAIYITATRLQKQGLLDARMGEPTPRRGGRGKRFFSITPAGAAALERTRQMLADLWDGVALPSPERRS